MTEPRIRQAIFWTSIAIVAVFALQVLNSHGGAF